MAEGAYEAIPATRWDVYRDRDGKPVTVTPEQCAAIRHAVQVYSEVCDAGGLGVFDSRTLLGLLHFMNAKSALMGRMLYDGRPPLDRPPPTTHMAAPAWHLYDADLCPDCFGERTAAARYGCAREWHPAAKACQHEDWIGDSDGSQQWECRSCGFVGHDDLACSTGDAAEHWPHHVTRVERTRVQTYPVEATAAQVFAAAHPHCCPRCGWHLSAHGHSHGFQSDCPQGVSPAQRDGTLAALKAAT